MKSEFVVLILLVGVPISLVVAVFFGDLLWDFCVFLKTRREEKLRKKIQSIVADLYFVSSAHDVRLRRLESNQKNKQVKK